MGVRISKSFKVAPGVRVRVNTKSTSVSLGGKGMRYTVNSKGRRTTTVGVPGTGVRAQRVSGTRRSAPRQHVSRNRRTWQRSRRRRNQVLWPKGREASLQDPGGEWPRLSRVGGPVRSRWPRGSRQRVAAATLAGLFALGEAPDVADPCAWMAVIDSGVEVANDPFLRRYAPDQGVCDGGGRRPKSVRATQPRCCDHVASDCAVWWRVTLNKPRRRRRVLDGHAGGARVAAEDCRAAGWRRPAGKDAGGDLGAVGASPAAGARVLGHHRSDAIAGSTPNADNCP